jgi:hypothetical protein
MNRKICYQKRAPGKARVGRPRWRRWEDIMRSMLGGAIGGIAIAALAAGLGGGAAKAHHSDWGLPLVGGLVGGAGLTALYYNSQRHDGGGGGERYAPPAQVVQPVYVAPAATIPAAAPAVPSATTIEDQLNVLDQLAAKGYITPAQYQARRQALLDQL